MLHSLVKVYKSKKRYLWHFETIASCSETTETLRLQIRQPTSMPEFRCAGHRVAFGNS